MNAFWWFEDNKIAGLGRPGWALSLTAGRDSAMAFSACGDAVWQASQDALARSATVSLVQQKMGHF